MNIKQILKEVLEEIKSSEDISEVNEFLNRLNKELYRNKVNAKAVFGGSFAKGVWLKGDYDVDIFVKFNIRYKTDELSDLLEKSLKKFKPVRVHGSRDYFHIKNSINYEIVPVLDIKNSKDAKNVTDFSPLHVKWVNSKGNKIKDEIMLTKKFMKAQGIYGAENYIRGFSGHVVDILVIYYDGFLQLLREATKWKAKQIIDIKNNYKGKALLMINKSKTEGPLVIIDPVQPDRNAAAAVGDEKFNKFIKSAKEFLRNPSRRLFVEQKINIEDLKKNKSSILIEIKSLSGKEDIVGAKILKSFDFIKKELTEFGIIKSGWQWDKKEKAIFWFLVKNKQLPKTFIREGPPLKLTEHVKKFKQKHKRTIIKNNKIYGIIKRKSTNINKFSDSLLKDKYLSDKVKSIKVIK